MTKPLPRGLVPSLVLACHPLPTAAMTIALTVPAAYVLTNALTN